MKREREKEKETRYFTFNQGRRFLETSPFLTLPDEVILNALARKFPRLIQTARRKIYLIFHLSFEDSESNEFT